MIHQALKFITDKLTAHFNGIDKPGGLTAIPTAILQNIGRLEEQDLKKANNIMLTLVNISEEAAMKNDPGAYTVGNSTSHYENPPVNLNLYLLFTVCMTNYEHALIYLSHTISFFQGKCSFSKRDSTTEINELPDDFRIIFDLHSLTFEQSNYLWSTLGGKQHPFVCYKVRLMQMKREAIRETRGVIREISIDKAG